MTHPDEFMDDLAARAIETRALHNLWAALDGAEGIRKQYRAELLSFQNLALTALVVSRRSFFVALLSFYDRDPKAVSIYRMDAHLKLKGKMDAAWDARLDLLQPLIAKARVVRNKFYAHVDETQFSRDILKLDVAATYDEISHLARETWALVDGLSHRQRGRHLVFNYEIGDELRQLFPRYSQTAPWG